MAVIAVFSGAFCSAEQIIGQVAQRLGYSVVGPELIEQAAQSFGTSAEKLARAMTGSRGFLDAITHEWAKSIVYLKAALAQLLKTDDQIYHGPAMHLIPGALTHVLRVGIIADQEYRVARAAEQSIDAREAASLIKRYDQELASWTRQLLSSGPWDPKLYDIKIPLLHPARRSPIPERPERGARTGAPPRRGARTGIPLPATSEAEAVDTIVENVQRDALKATDRSIQAVLDFQLATRINVALLDGGHANCDVEAEAGRVTVAIHQRSRSPGALARTVQALRYENVEQEVQKIAAGFEGVKSIDVRPGAGYGRPSRTLLVDDERDYVMTLSERLEMRDIPADVAYDGQEALTFVDTEAPDVMVLDLRMPGMDGLEVLRRIKRDHPQVEVIIVTGHGTDKDEQIARELGAFDYLKKPVDISVLAQRIQEASRQAQRERGDETEDDD